MLSIGMLFYLFSFKKLKLKQSSFTYGSLKTLVFFLFCLAGMFVYIFCERFVE